MVKLYVDLINKSLRTVEQVPSIWREDVQKQLEDEGYSKG